MNTEKDVPGRCEQGQRPEGRSVPREFQEQQGDQGGERKRVVRNLERQWASLVAQVVKNLPMTQETRGRSLSREDPQRRKGQPTPVVLRGKSHGQRSLAGYSLWGCRVGHD